MSTRPGPRVAVLVAVLLAVLMGQPLVAPAAAAPGDQAAAELVQGGPILLLVDTSGSMTEDDGTGVIKIEGAKAALLDLINKLPRKTQIGLRTYPSLSGSGCNAGHLDIGIAERNPADMDAEIRSITADGDTPTAEALTAAADDVKRLGYTEATIVLVSDGEHTCTDPCAVAQDLRAQGLGITVDTVGFQIDAGGADELECISGATGGTYTHVDDSAQLGERLAELQGARLTLDVGEVPTFSPVSEGTLTMTATVTNESDVTGGNVRVALTYDPESSGGAPAVITPIRLLGNLEPGGTRTVSWSVYPSRIRGSGELDWTVTLTATGVPVQAKAGVTTLTEEMRLDDAGPVLSEVDDVVIIGDSYSPARAAARTPARPATAARTPGADRRSRRPSRCTTWPAPAPWSPTTGPRTCSSGGTRSTTSTASAADSTSWSAAATWTWSRSPWVETTSSSATW